MCLLLTIFYATTIIKVTRDQAKDAAELLSNQLAFDFA